MGSIPTASNFLLFSRVALSISTLYWRRGLCIIERVNSRELWRRCEFKWMRRDGEWWEMVRLEGKARLGLHVRVASSGSVKTRDGVSKTITRTWRTTIRLIATSLPESASYSAAKTS